VLIEQLSSGNARAIEGVAPTAFTVTGLQALTKIKRGHPKQQLLVRPKVADQASSWEAVASDLKKLSDPNWAFDLDAPATPHLRNRYFPRFVLIFSFNYRRPRRWR